MGLAINVNTDYTSPMTQIKPTDAHHHGNLKEALVSYALSAADQGVLSELSVRKAARDLGVSPGAAYRHFPDKDALMRTVAARGFDALADAFEKAVPFESTVQSAGEARRRFARLAMAYTEFARTRTELRRLMFGPLGLAPTSKLDRPSTYDWLAKCLAELAEFGIIGEPQAEHQLFAWSAIHGLSDLQSSPAIGGQSSETSVERQCALVINALAV
ncbi:TetR/AcrR family transcriptional regulator [Devosia sp.]|jgi:AcrR family transcriptional regulator|uniref:TetR/AcrR family transcriptional regulator n=1 Tax=Devosia sp. TaxID=1871048 RepID=UPI0037C05D73